jgi:hypothetical protein
MYCLEAVVACEEALRRIAGSRPEAHIVPLDTRLALLLMTDEFFDAITVAGGAALDGFWKAPLGVGDLLTTASQYGPVAYVEADFFGGTGTQCAQVWDGGSVLGRHRETSAWKDRL